MGVVGRLRTPLLQRPRECGGSLSREMFLTGIWRVAVTSDGTRVEVNEMTADASAYVFRYEFDRQP